MIERISFGKAANDRDATLERDAARDVLDRAIAPRKATDDELDDFLRDLLGHVAGAYVVTPEPEAKP